MFVTEFRKENGLDVGHMTLADRASSLPNTHTEINQRPTLSKTPDNCDIPFTTCRSFIVQKSHFVQL